MGMFPGPSVPGGHSVLAAMLFAAAPDEAGLWRTDSNDGLGARGSGGDRALEFLEPFPLKSENKNQPLDVKQQTESIFVKAFQQELKAKEAIEQATARPSSTRNTSKNQGTSQRGRKRKNRVRGDGEAGQRHHSSVHRRETVPERHRPAGWKPQSGSRVQRGD